MADASSFKDQGNEEFKKENYLRAATLYTKAIDADPKNAVLYSNRSAAFLKLMKVQKALKDAEECISLKPEWDKGYFRKAAALEAMDKFEEALDVYNKAHSVAPDNKEVAAKVRTLSKYINTRNKQAAASATA